MKTDCCFPYNFQFWFTVRAIFQKKVWSEINSEGAFLFSCTCIYKKYPFIIRDMHFEFLPAQKVILLWKYKGSSLSTIFGILKKSYYAKFVLVSTT